jgi:hypothetical protein
MEQTHLTMIEAIRETQNGNIVVENEDTILIISPANIEYIEGDKITNIVSIHLKQGKMPVEIKV